MTLQQDGPPGPQVREAHPTADTFPGQEYLGDEHHLCELCGQEFDDIQTLADHPCGPVLTPRDIVTDGGLTVLPFSHRHYHKLRLAVFPTLRRRDKFGSVGDKVAINVGEQHKRDRAGEARIVAKETIAVRDLSTAFLCFDTETSVIGSARRAEARESLNSFYQTPIEDDEQITLYWLRWTHRVDGVLDRDDDTAEVRADGGWIRQEVASQRRLGQRLDQGACPHVKPGELSCNRCFFDERGNRDD